MHRIIYICTVHLYFRWKEPSMIFICINTRVSETKRATHDFHKYQYARIWDEKSHAWFSWTSNYIWKLWKFRMNFMRTIHMIFMCIGIHAKLMKISYEFHAYRTHEFHAYGNTCEIHAYFARISCMSIRMIFMSGSFRLQHACIGTHENRANFVWISCVAHLPV